MFKLFIFLVYGGMYFELDLEDDYIYNSFDLCAQVGEKVIESSKPDLNKDKVGLIWICEEVGLKT